MPDVTPAELAEALDNFRLQVTVEGCYDLSGHRIGIAYGTVTDPTRAAHALHRELGAYAGRDGERAPDVTPDALPPLPEKWADKTPGHIAAEAHDRSLFGDETPVPWADPMSPAVIAWEAAAEAVAAPLRERIRQAEATARLYRECEAELQEIHDSLLGAYGRDDLSEDTPAVVAAVIAERDEARGQRDAEAIRLGDLLVIAERDRDDAVTLLDGCQRELGLAVDRKREAEGQRDDCRTLLDRLADAAERFADRYGTIEHVADLRAEIAVAREALGGDHA